MNWAEIITALTPALSIALGIWVYRNQKSTDYLFKKKENEDQEKIKTEKARLNSAFADIYFRLNKIIMDLEADRVYIIQPHPLQDKKYISVSFELVNKIRDVREHKHNFQNKPMSEWAGMIGVIGKEDWIAYPEVCQIPDMKWRNWMKRKGVASAFYHRLTENDKYWVATICVEFTRDMPLSSPEMIDMIEKVISTNSQMIADILPEYNP